MKYTVMIAMGMVLGICSCVIGQVPKHPFPNHTRYVTGSIRPMQLSQVDLDNSARKFYALWKKNYLKHDCADTRQYYVLNDEGNVRSSRSVICVSEGQGYGMQIMVLMAGFDKQAQIIYDGMFRFVAAHPTTKSPDLMSWSILKNCVTNIEHTGDEDENTSATDGDMDIALSLLMADAQWGSKGSINYRKEGIKRIKAILGFEINKTNHTVLLSDANHLGDDDYYDIRTSDFMPAYLRVFSRYLPNPEWKLVIDTMYGIFAEIQAKYSPQAGLLPDFIAYKSHQYLPAKPHYLESKFDGDYYYNACRVPFRVAIDFLLNKESRAQHMLMPMNDWIQAKTQINADNIGAGYFLDGQQIPNHNYATPAFVCPFTIAAMVDNNKQKWVNDCWNTVADFEIKDYQYFDNSIQMLSLIIISGNYWLP